MLRPYLAVVKDSFRAIMGSSVLYVTLALITVVLLLLFPLRLVETLDFEIGELSIYQSTSAVAEEIFQGSQPESSALLQRVWSRLPEDVKTEIENTVKKKKDKEANPEASGESTETQPETSDAEATSAAESEDESEKESDGSPRRGRGRRDRESLASLIAKGLNQIIQQPDFYDADLWKSEVLGSEAQALVKEGPQSLTTIRRSRFNRLLLSEIVRELPRPEKTSAKLYYAIWHASFVPVGVTGSELTNGIKNIVQLIFSTFILTAGTIVAIVLTSTMIPETFEPGSLNLLLSKPIHRSGLFLSKFVGGLAFITLCAAYLFLGTWLWMGICLGTWDRATLISIPLFVFVFGIYLSVSMFVGLIYRSAIVSVVLTAVFWGFCFGIGSVHGFLQARVQNDQLVWAQMAGEQAIAMDKFGLLKKWDETKKHWEPLADNTDGMRDEEKIGFSALLFFEEFPMFPSSLPIVNDEQGTMCTLQFFPIPPGGAFMGASLVVADLKTGAQATFNAPGGIALLKTKDRPILVTTSGTFEAIDVTKLLQSPHAAKTRSLIPTDCRENLGPTVPKDRFGLSILDPARVACDSATGNIVIYSKDDLMLFERNEQGYQATKKLVVESGSKRIRMSCRMEFANGFVVLAFGNSQISLIDTREMKLINSYRPEPKYQPTQICFSSIGQEFLVQFRNGKVWGLKPTEPDAMRLAKLPNQGAITGIGCDATGNLAICHSIDRVNLVQGDTLQTTATYSDNTEIIKNLYRYLVHPLYQVSPKPREFYNVVNHFSSTTDTSINNDVDLLEVDIYRDPLSPIWSGLGFMAVVLGLSCLYFIRMDC